MPQRQRPPRHQLPRLLLQLSPRSPRPRSPFFKSIVPQPPQPKLLIPKTHRWAADGGCTLRAKWPGRNREHQTNNRFAVPGLWAKVYHRAASHGRCCNRKDYPTTAEQHFWLNVNFKGNLNGISWEARAEAALTLIVVTLCSGGNVFVHCR